MNPLSLNNLAGLPGYIAIQVKLVKELIEWQIRTLDPLREDELLQGLTKEMDETFAENPNLSYRNDSNFHWNYHTNLGLTITPDLMR